MQAPPARLTIGLIALTTLAYLVVAISGQSATASVTGGFIAIRFLQDAGPGFVPFFLTPLTATLLHGGLMHLGFNMMMLAFCGRYVEAVLGMQGTLLLYVVGAYAAAAAQFVVDPMSNAPMVGASGAISAIVAGYALLFGKRKTRDGNPVGLAAHIASLAFGWIFLQLLMGLAARGMNQPIAIAAHIGGFIIGLLITVPLLRWRYARQAG